jgi:hypothetical protein
LGGKEGKKEKEKEKSYQTVSPVLHIKLKKKIG